MRGITVLFRRKIVLVNHANGQRSEVWHRLRRNKAAMFGLVVLVVILSAALFADVIADYDTKVLSQNPEKRLQPPSFEHPFGTDQFGRDLFARIIHGARYSLTFGIVCTLLAIGGGAVLGAASAFFGGKVDNIIMRALDAFMCIPGMLLAMAMVSTLGAGLTNMILAISISSIPPFARIVRSAVLTVVQQDYIEAARASGVGTARTILMHVVPNAMGTVIVNAMMNVAGLIIAAAGLSFIGMGIQPPAPEWGAMLSESTTYMRRFPHMVIAPGMAILVTAMCFNLLGDGLAEALDPRLRE
jgi:peptide/nickel transport system permease protein